MRMKCFFDGTHGVGPCDGPVVRVSGNLPRFMQGSARFRKDTAYCEAHRRSNTARARWEGVGRPTPALMTHMVQSEENETTDWEGRDD